MDRDHRMDVEYDGTGLHGWAKQDGLPTVEDCLETALRTVLGHTPGLRAAGRTDAGVHARRQVVSLRFPESVDLCRLVASLNALTPPGIAVKRVSRAAPGFDARKQATSRTYRYFISTAATPSPFWGRYSWYVGRRLDLSVLRAAAAAVEGRHDFTAFTPTETGHVFFHRSVLRCRWRRAAGSLPAAAAFAGGRAGLADGGILCLEIEAEAFLRHMVRVLVGTMVEMSSGARDPDCLATLLKGAAREDAGPTAPAHGLFLWDVSYRGAAGERPGARAGARAGAEAGQS